MKEIRYTIGNSPLWHSLFFEFELVNEVRDDMLIAYLITQELKTMGIHEQVKEVRIFDEEHRLLAFSKDISVTASLKYEIYESL